MLIAVGVIACHAGCEAGRPAEPAGPDRVMPDPFAAVPDDFTLDITVVRGPALSADDPAPRAPAPVFARPGHWVLLADGSLHWAGGQDPAAQGLPPRRRVLDLPEVARLWLLAGQLGLADPAGAMAPVNPRLLEVRPGQVAYLAILTGRGRRWAYERRVDAGQPADEVMARFIGRLAELAWIEPPVRLDRDETGYDFGPDPYARYRR